MKWWSAAADMPAARGLADPFILDDLLFDFGNGVGASTSSSWVIAGTEFPFGLEKL
jgi:hypothetical protein